MQLPTTTNFTDHFATSFGVLVCDRVNIRIDWALIVIRNGQSTSVSVRVKSVSGTVESFTHSVSITDGYCSRVTDYEDIRVREVSIENQTAKIIF